MTRATRALLDRLGVENEAYRVKGGDDDSLPSLTGHAFTKDGRLLGVAEMAPTGWGGDGKWRLRSHRTADGEQPGPCHTIQPTLRQAVSILMRECVRAGWV